MATPQSRAVSITHAPRELPAYAAAEVGRILRVGPSRAVTLVRLAAGRRDRCSFLELVTCAALDAVFDARLAAADAAAVEAYRDLLERLLGARWPLASRAFWRQADALLTAEPRGGAAGWRRRIAPAAARARIERRSAELEWDERDRYPVRWWIAGREMPVVLDPSVAWGRPTIAGTAVAADLAARCARASGAAAAAAALDLTRDQVEAAVLWAIS
jgi:hypothetical protein